MSSTIEQFEFYGLTASFHYADDTTEEWRFGDKEKRAALRLFDDNPDLQDEMRVIAKGFLWSLESERKS